MPIEMGLWRIDGERPLRLTPTQLPTEKSLEDFLAQDPSLLGERLLVIGRQVPTKQGKFIDLLAIDAEGCIHVLELKRDKTPREVVAQVLDYGQWVSTLERDDIRAIAEAHLGQPFSVAFDDVFGDSLPEDINAARKLVIVATQLDDSSERIVRYLREFGVPINAIFFAHLEDEGRRYLARSWLVEETRTEKVSGAKTGKASTKATWNNVDWYVSFGEEAGGRNWEDARHFGFVSAGGGLWYGRTLRQVPQGARVSVYIPQAGGYVAVGRVTGPAQRFDQALVQLNGAEVLLADQSLVGTYEHEGKTSDADAEWVLPVEWIDDRPAADAFRVKGMFANQNSACRLSDEFTLEQLRQHFAVDDES